VRKVLPERGVVGQTKRGILLRYDWRIPLPHNNCADLFGNKRAFLRLFVAFFIKHNGLCGVSAAYFFACKF
jgi:hypothetical protein